MRSLQHIHVMWWLIHNGRLKWVLLGGHTKVFACNRLPMALRRLTGTAGLREGDWTAGASSLTTSSSTPNRSHLKCSGANSYEKTSKWMHKSDQCTCTSLKTDLKDDCRSGTEPACHWGRLARPLVSVRACWRGWGGWSGSRWGWSAGRGRRCGWPPAAAAPETPPASCSGQTGPSSRLDCRHRTRVNSCRSSIH